MPAMGTLVTFLLYPAVVCLILRSYYCG